MTSGSRFLRKRGRRALDWERLRDGGGEGMLDMARYNGKVYENCNYIPVIREGPVEYSMFK